MLCDHSLKNKVFHNLNSSSMYILLKKTRTFILTGCREYLCISVCI